MTVRLHIPDEPVELLALWRRRLALGASIDDVLFGPDGIEAWYWERWRAVERIGIGRERFSDVASRHRRELGLWLRGERRHESVASSFSGRVARSVPSPLDADAEPPRNDTVRQIELESAVVSAHA